MAYVPPGVADMIVGLDVRLAFAGLLARDSSIDATGSVKNNLEVVNGPDYYRPES